MKCVDVSGVVFVVIIGEDELKVGIVIVKYMCEGNVEEGCVNQSNMVFDGVVDYIVEQIVGDYDYDYDYVYYYF